MIEDANLVLINDDGDVSEKAKTLGAVGLLAGYSHQELLALHLDSCGLLLAEAIDATNSVLANGGK